MWNKSEWSQCFGEKIDNSGCANANECQPYEGKGEGGESTDERDEAAPGGDEQEEDAGQGAHQ